MPNFQVDTDAYIFYGRRSDFYLDSLALTHRPNNDAKLDARSWRHPGAKSLVSNLRLALHVRVDLITVSFEMCGRK